MAPGFLAKSEMFTAITYSFNYLQKSKTKQQHPPPKIPKSRNTVKTTSIRKELKLWFVDEDIISQLCM